MPSDLVSREDFSERNRKVLFAIFGVIALLVAISVITILVKN
ncbi:MAG TPA: hypothetical protein VMT64_03690 [Candidatus Binataceae bacterium]|nr:hypothetical protein [Candidatus Binataceae bacterium]